MTDESERPGVEFSDRQDRPVDVESLSDLAAAVLQGEGAAHAELSISLVDEEEMAGLHQRYLGEPGPTDVLSFPMEEPAGPGEVSGEPAVLGDVVVCPAVAARREDPEAELRLLVVHGILHLLGYDHESGAEREEMWRRQERYSGVRVPLDDPSEPPQGRAVP